MFGFIRRCCVRQLSTSLRRSRAKVIDGKAMSNEIESEIKYEIDKWIAAGNRRPQLTAVLVGDDPASSIYVRNKMRAAQYTGISSRTIHLAPSVSEAEVLYTVQSLNCDNEVDGILVQLPLPPQVNERRVCDAVVPWKDVDAFNVVNVGRFCCDAKAMIPATPAGVVEMIRRTGITTLGKNAVVCGRSKNVGMPIAMLLHADGKNGDNGACDATTTICHRNTPHDQLRVFTLTADILIVATGIPGLITSDMIKDGAAVIDVGITQIIDKVTGKRRLVGDVDFKGVSEKAGYITPVPGGVGPMTVAMLMRNTLTAARREIEFDGMPARVLTPTRDKIIQQTITGSDNNNTSPQLRQALAEVLLTK